MIARRSAEQPAGFRESSYPAARHMDKLIYRID
jgi:hypothetical protein